MTVNRFGPDTLGDMLRRWRTVRGKSQLDLAFDAELSQRHVSFIESGRSVPKRLTLTRIARALDIPFRESNLLLLAAGYAPVYDESTWDAHEMRMITSAVRRMLRQHQPFPAVVLDRGWNVVMSNDSTLPFFNLFVDMGARRTPRNFLHLLFDPSGMRPFIANWEDTARGLLERMHRESVGRVVDQGLLAALLAYPDVQPEWHASRPGPVMPVIPLSIIKGDLLLNYFSMVMTVGTPQTVAAQELRIDFLFPADDETDAHHRALDLTGP